MTNLTDYEKKIVTHIKRNRDKGDLFIANIPHVSASGMSRHIKFAIIYKGKFLNVTYLIAKILGKKLNRNDVITVQGCGMDMIFATLESLYASLGYDRAYELRSVGVYRTF